MRMPKLNGWAATFPIRPSAGIRNANRQSIAKDGRITRQHFQVPLNHDLWTEERSRKTNDELGNSNMREILMNIL
jgi:hypothetical protein